MSKYFPIFGPRSCFYCDDVDDIVVFGGRRVDANAEAEENFTTSKSMPQIKRKRGKKRNIMISSRVYSSMLYIYRERK